MKQFFRTVFGKSFLYFLSVVAIAFCVASVFGIVAAFYLGLYSGGYTSFYETIPYYFGSISNYGELESFLVLNFSQYINILPYVAVGSLVLALIFLTCLVSVSGKVRGTEEIEPGLIDIIPFDIILAIEVFCAIVGYSSIDWACDYFGIWGGIIYIILLVLVTICVFVGNLMDFATRCKEKTIFRNTLIGIVLRFIWKIIASIGNLFGRIIGSIPMIWKGLILVSVVFVIEAIAIASNWYSNLNEEFLCMWIFEKIVLFVAIGYWLVDFSIIKKGTEALAKGDLEYKTKTLKMLPDMKTMGENLNSISVGMKAAVEENLKSERMKTELITNVSHDIKTPLTSIINYSDLIEKEHSDNEKIAEYSEVIHRQSVRLKRLLEDLLELSKSSTGNTEVHLEKCEAGILLSQAVAEFEDRFETLGLETVISVPEEPIEINADRRLLWRVFDNLLSNICKYALSGTRVFFTIKHNGNNVCIFFKNTSRDILNITPDELKGRFVRGDVSRTSTTEGNGLGLAIAESLTSIQGGTLELFIDADLFTAVVTFPVSTENTTQMDSVS